jgi:hypothetical protein
MERLVCGSIFIAATVTVSWGIYLYKELFRDILENIPILKHLTRSNGEEIGSPGWWEDLPDEEREVLLRESQNPLGDTEMTSEPDRPKPGKG